MFGRHRQITGLDIGTSFVKAVQVRREPDGCTVTAAVQTAVPPSNSGEEANRNTVAAVSKCLQSVPGKTRDVVCGVSGPEVVVRNFRFPAMPEEEVRKAVMLEASMVCPLDMESCSWDYHLQQPDAEAAEGSSSAGKLGGILVVSAKSLVERKALLVERAGNNCAMMDVDGLALLNCVRECDRSQDGAATIVLNVGSTYTNVAMVHGNERPFVRDLAYAGNDIVEATATRHEISVQQVQEALWSNGESSNVDEELRPGFERACTKLVNDVRETIRYYLAQERTVLDRICLCGGFARARGFVEVLAGQFQRDVVLWNPFKELRCSRAVTNSESGDSGLAFAVATGLAMRSI